MALPKLSQPIFTLTMPSSGKKVRYRQFTVKEEKILLTAQASGEKSDMIEAFKQLVTNCCQEKIDVDAMPAFDVEYFFLQLRAKSVSNVIKLNFEEAGLKSEVEINLDELKVHKPTVSNKIVLDDKQGIGVLLKYPTFSMIEKMATSDDEDQVNSSIGLFKEVIDSIFDAESVYPTKDAAKGELEDFILSLNNLQVSKIQEFLEDMPYVYIDVKYKVGEEWREQRVRGIDNFFA